MSDEPFKVRQAEEEVRVCAAINIGHTVFAMYARSGLQTEPNGSDVGIEEEFGLKVPSDLATEQYLEMLIYPETLSSGTWKSRLATYQEASPAAGGPEQLRKLTMNLDVVNDQVDRALSILNLHSAALYAMTNGATEASVQKVMEHGREKALVNLQQSVGRAIASSDRDLSGLPFSHLADMDAFFQRKSKVQKLAFHLLSYFQCGQGNAAELMRATLGNELQPLVLWHPEHPESVRGT